jgi:hypothetical protein
VAVVDTKPPTIQCGTNKVVQLGTDWSFDAPFASDSCYGTNVTITVVGTITNNDGCSLNITRTWQAADGNGNSSVGSQTVTVLDMQPLDLSSLKVSPSTLRPNGNELVTVTIEGTVTNGCGAIADYSIVSVADGQLPKSRLSFYKITGPKTVLLRAKANARQQVTYQVTVSAKDACGNTGTRTIPVVVGKTR